MVIYYFLGGLLSIVALVPGWVLRSEAKYRLSLFLALGPAALAGLRGAACCRDYIVYQEYYGDSPDAIAPSAFLSEWLDKLPNVDVGYVWCSSFLKKAGVSFEGLILVVALASVIATVSAYRRTTALPVLALVFYYAHPFFYREMIQVRAGLACAAGLWAFALASEHSPYRAGAAVLLAVSMHLSSALIVVPLVLLWADFQLSGRRVVLGLGCAYLASVFITPDAPIFSDISRIAVYVDSVYAGELGVLTNPTTIKQCAILGIALHVDRKWGYGNSSRLMRLLLTSYFVSTLWLVAFNKFEIVGGRGASFLSFVEPVIVGNVVWRVHEMRPRHAWLANGAAVSIAAFILMLNLEVKEVVDTYTSWLPG